MAFLDRYTGDNDYRRAARSKKAANEAAAEASKAQAEALRSQTEAAERAQRQAEKAAFTESMSNITFAGDADKIVKDFDTIYQHWLDGNLEESQKKIIKDKLELGMMALKKADPMKADFYEKKINDEKKKRKIKTIAIASGVGVLIIVFLIIGIVYQ